MRTGWSLLAALGVAAFVPSASAAERPVVAVLPFNGPAGAAVMAKSVQPTFVTGLVKSKKVRVVNEKQARSAVQRFEREMTGLYDPSKIKQMGRFLKADYVVSGMIADTGGGYTMTVHLTNVETLELEMAEDVDFANRGKLRVAVRAMAKRVAAAVSGGAAEAGRHEAFLDVDARSFYDTADACIAALERLDGWRYEGEIDEELGGRKVHVMLEHGKPRPGMPLQVLEPGLGTNDRPIGVVYVTEPDAGGGGFLAEWIKEKDPAKKKKGGFGLGARVSNAGYRYRIAVGPIQDEAAGDEALSRMFVDKLLETLDGSDRFVVKTEDEVKLLADNLGRGSTRKQRLARLHAEGVDFVLVGRFIGAPGSRRADFELVSTVTGKVWQDLEFETRI